MRHDDARNSKTENIQRLFVALPLPEEIRNEISNLINGLKQGCKFINFPMTWTQPQALHLTLKFLGDVPVDRIGEISRVLRSITGRYAPLRLKTHEMGVFPNWKRPRVLWLGIGCAGPELMTMQTEIWQELDRYCAKNEKNNFQPHLTIGRFKSFAKMETAKNLLLSHRRFKTEHFIAGSVVLYRSELMSSGAVHSVVENFELSVSESRTNSIENNG